MAGFSGRRRAVRCGALIVSIGACAAAGGDAWGEPNGYWTHGSTLQPPPTYGSAQEACRGLFDQDKVYVNPATAQYDGCIPWDNDEYRSGWHSAFPYSSVPFFYGAVVWLKCDDGYDEVATRCEAEDLPDLDCQTNHGGNPSPSTMWPIEILTGKKRLSVEDFSFADGSLSLNRTFSSKSFNGSGDAFHALLTGLGNWSFDFQLQLQIPPNFAYYQRVSLLTPDGAAYVFARQGDGSMSPYTPFTRPLPQTDFALELVGAWPSSPGNIENVPSTWQVTGPDESVWLFETTPDQLGKYRIARPTQRTSRLGHVTTFSYTSLGVLTSISESRGKSISFTWATEDGYPLRITEAQLPGGDKLIYEYQTIDSDPYSRARLVEVRRVNASAVLLDKAAYDYDDSRWPLAVTGVRDRDDTLRWQIAYDGDLRATLSSGPGGAFESEVAYGAMGASFTRTVTGPLGRDTVYTFGRTTGLFDVRLTDIDGAATTHCPATNTALTYGASPPFLSSVTDPEGRITTYGRDSRGRPTSLTEADGTAVERTSTITWSPDGTAPSEIVSPGITATITYEAP